MARDAICCLNEEALGIITGRAETPAHDRRCLHPSIVHLGVGAFHRAHQAVYLRCAEIISTPWHARLRASIRPIVLESASRDHTPLLCE